MPFQVLPDAKGLIYVPLRCDLPKKHPCPDCFSCLNCADDRCRLCLGNRKCLRCDNERKKKSEEG